MHLIIQNLEVKIYVVYILKDNEKSLQHVFSSSGSIELYLTEICGGPLMFVVCLVGVWQRNFEPVVCVYGMTGWDSPSYRTHTHHWFKITLPNTDQAHDKRQ